MAQAEVQKKTPDPLAGEAERAEQQVKRTIMAVVRHYGWTQTELASRIEMSKASLNGKHRPTASLSPPKGTSL